MGVKLTIIAQMRQVAREHGKSLAPLDDGLVLSDSGLDSLSFAVLVARLEDTLGLNPFMAEKVIFLPVTFGDFVELYEHGAG